MSMLVDDELLTKIRRGPEPHMAGADQRNKGPLFVPRPSLRSMTVLVDRDLVDAAATDERVAHLLGLLARQPPPHRQKLEAVLVHRYWYSDEGPASDIPRLFSEGSRRQYVPEWLLVNWNDDPKQRVIVYQEGKRVRAAAMWSQDALLDTLTEEDVPDSYRRLADPYDRMRKDVVALWAATSLSADVFITQREFLLNSNLRGGFDGLLLKPAHALAFVGLFLRQQRSFISMVTPDGRIADRWSPRGMYWIGAQELLPAVWRWRRAFALHSTETGDSELASLAYTLVHRVAQVLAARDDLFSHLFRPQTHDAPHDVVSALDNINLLLMAAFDNAARVAHKCLGVSGTPRSSGWQYKDGWLKKVERLDPRVSKIVAEGSAGASVIHILSSLRNTIHGELSQLMSEHRSMRAPTTKISLPRSDAESIVGAAANLGGIESLGIERHHSPGAYGRNPSYFLDPGSFIERFLPHAINLLNDLIAAVPVETLAGVEAVLDLNKPPSESEMRYDPKTGRLVLAQLGLS